MNNPFTPPQTSLDAAQTTAGKDGVLFWFVAVGATIASIALSLLMAFALPAFEDVYRSFGADLPVPTKALVQWRYSLLLPSAVAIGLWLFRGRSASRGQLCTWVRTSFFFLGLFSASLLVFAIWALYLPIFKIGIAQ